MRQDNKFFTNRISFEFMTRISLIRFPADSCSRKWCRRRVTKKTGFPEFALMALYIRMMIVANGLARVFSSTLPSPSN